MVTSVTNAQRLASTSFEPAQGYGVGNLVGQQSPPWQDDSGGNLFQVTSLISHTGTSSVSVNTALVGGSAWAWQDLSEVNIASGNDIIVARTWIHIDSDGTSDPASAAGIDAYSLAPFARMAALRFSPATLNHPGGVQILVDTVAYESIFPAPTFGAWHEAILTLDLSAGTAAGAFGGQQLFVDAPFAMPFWTPGTSEFADADLYAVASGFNVCRFDDHRVDAVPKGTLMGRVDLQNWTGLVAGHIVTVQIRSNGSVLQELNVPLDSEGFFKATTAHRGMREVAVKSSHWLARQFESSVNITDFGAHYLHVSLVNGDADGDNEITLVDFAALATSFGSDSSSASWNPDADFDGDEEITLVDFGILAGNFGQAGD